MPSVFANNLIHTLKEIVGRRERSLVPVQDRIRSVTDIVPKDLRREVSGKDVLFTRTARNGIPTAPVHYFAEVLENLPKRPIVMVGPKERLGRAIKCSGALRKLH